MLGFEPNHKKNSLDVHKKNERHVVTKGLQNNGSLSTRVREAIHENTRSDWSMALKRRCNKDESSDRKPAECAIDKNQFNGEC